MRQKLFDRLPHIGQRITKTTIAVFLCLLVYYLRGYRGQQMPTEAAITAIICMQPYVRDSRDFALNRLAGTLIGGAWGLLFLLLLLVFPGLARCLPVLYLIMSMGILLSLYSAVLVRMPDTSSLAAIVYICVVIAFPEIEQPLLQAVQRITGVLVGTAIAIAVNIFHLPRDKQRDRVFFVRTRDLVPDRFSQIPSAALFRLNYLYNDGAKLCLMSEHAPAFFMLQMSEARLSVPLIVMDGAAIYDASENEYLQVEALPVSESDSLRRQLDALGLSYFIYTVHRGKTCIFHQGALREKEKVIYDRMRRSPYRSYLEGEILDETEIVYFKIIDDVAALRSLHRRLGPFLVGRPLRAVRRREAGTEDIGGLYIYANSATMERAQARLMAMLREKDPSLTPVEVFARSPYRSEHDAMQLLHRLGNEYEPLKITRLWRKKKLKKHEKKQ